VGGWMESINVIFLDNLHCFLIALLHGLRSNALSRRLNDYTRCLPRCKKALKNGCNFAPEPTMKGLLLEKRMEHKADYAEIRIIEKTGSLPVVTREGGRRRP
jgi:hypothetical protein